MITRIWLTCRPGDILARSQSLHEVQKQPQIEKKYVTSNVRKRIKMQRIDDNLMFSIVTSWPLKITNSCDNALRYRSSGNYIRFKGLKLWVG